MGVSTKQCIRWKACKKKLGLEPGAICVQHRPNSCKKEMEGKKFLRLLFRSVNIQMEPHTLKVHHQKLSFFSWESVHLIGIPATFSYNLTATCGNYNLSMSIVWCQSLRPPTVRDIRGGFSSGTCEYHRLSWKQDHRSFSTRENTILHR